MLHLRRPFDFDYLDSDSLKSNKKIVSKKSIEIQKERNNKITEET